jgi:hypothetical protein
MKLAGSHSDLVEKERSLLVVKKELESANVKLRRLAEQNKEVGSVKLALEKKAIGLDQTLT